MFFAQSSDPTMKIVCTDAFGAGSCTGANGVAIGGQTINVPAGLKPENGSDAHLTVIVRHRANTTSGKHRSAARRSPLDPVRS